MRPAPLWHRYDRLLGSDPAADVKDELRFHLETKVDDLVARGWSREVARKEAERQFGDILAVQRIGERIGEHMERRRLLRDYWADAHRDLGFTLRTLGRDRGFTLVAVLILALGIGANAAVFSVVNTILLRPLPFPHAEELVRIHQKDPEAGESTMTYSTDVMEEFQQKTHFFQQVTGYFAFAGPDNVKLMGSGQPQPITGRMVAGNFFPTLGVTPVLGRNFTVEETLKNGRPAVLLSYPFWKRQFGANPAIVGQSINLDGTRTIVVGVLPDTFDFGAVFSPGARVDVFQPAILAEMESWGNTMNLFGRLKPGVPLGQAQAEADTIFPNLVMNLKDPNQGAGSKYDAGLFGLKESVSGRLRQSLIILWCAVGMILLIVCVNLSNLLLARGAARAKEFAMRTALGAGRGRIVRQLLTESLVLSSAGAIFGLLLAFTLVRWLAHQGSIALPLLSSLRIDGATLAWTLLIGALSTVFFGLVPGLRMASSDVQESLKDSSAGSGQSRKHERIRSILVVTEVALTCMLLVGAGLLLRSFLHVLDVDLGFEPSHAAAISVSYDDSGGVARRGVILQQVIQRVEQIPGVETAGISDELPMSSSRSWGMAPKGWDSVKAAILPPTFVYVVTPGYLHAIGMRIVAGRDFTWDDTNKNVGAVIINETVAQHLWPGQDAVGKIAEINSPDQLAQVIGVVADVHETNAETPPGWQMYLSQTAPQFGPIGANLVVRTKLPPETLASTVMTVLRELNPKQPANEFKPIQMLVDHASSPRRFFVMLVGAFASLGLLLAALGIYGVISYSVTQRTQEIGVRMALGATTSQVQLSVIARALRLAFVGVMVGSIASFFLSRAIAALLFNTAPNDPVTFAAMVLILGLVALLAGYIPARRASRINPIQALRSN
jgi:predicted permease